MSDEALNQLEKMTGASVLRSQHILSNCPSTNKLDSQTRLNGRGWNSVIASRAEETSGLLQSCLDQLIPFISKADSEQEAHHARTSLPSEGTSLVHPKALQPKTLQGLLENTLRITENGTGAVGLENTVRDLLAYSVNPTSPGFMDKLYAQPLPPGIAAELILAVLNANLHVYQVSPALTTIEKHVTKQLAGLFSLNSPRAGGISVTGGSASNLTSIVVARNSLYPDTKIHGNSSNGRRLVMFTSAHGHYSIEKAAQGLGFGSEAAIPVPVDTEGKMIASELERLIVEANAHGQTPFYINATAGTTVLGSFDPFVEISRIARKYRCWMHVDGAWGGSFIFPQREDFRAKLKGVGLADSIGINPHKMLGVPVTCSILLGRDLRLFEAAMTLKAGYLFHEAEEDDNISHPSSDRSPSPSVDDESQEFKDIMTVEIPGSSSFYDERDDPNIEWTEPNDLADMTLQCGRRADSLKLFLSWQYYGTQGYAAKIQHAYDIAVHMSDLVNKHPDLTPVLAPGSKPSCLQVCFYYTPQSRFVFGLRDDDGESSKSRSIISHPYARTAEEIGKQNTRVVSRTCRALIARGFMVDYSPALEGQEDRGHFFRVVVNISTIQPTVERLVEEIVSIGQDVVVQLKQKFGPPVATVVVQDVNGVDGEV